MVFIGVTNDPQIAGTVNHFSVSSGSKQDGKQTFLEREWPLLSQERKTGADAGGGGDLVARNQGRSCLVFLCVCVFSEIGSKAIGEAVGHI